MNLKRPYFKSLRYIISYNAMVNIKSFQDYQQRN